MEAQEKAVKAAGAEIVYKDIYTGTKTDNKLAIGMVMTSRINIISGLYRNADKYKKYSAIRLFGILLVILFRIRTTSNSHVRFCGTVREIVYLH